MDPAGLRLGPDFQSEGKHTALDLAYQHVLGCIQKSFDTNGKDAKTFLADLRSTVICWGCDIRVETDSLDSIRNTMFETVIRSTFDKMIVLLQHFEGSGSSEDLVLQTELEQCTRRLESFVSSIRMSQVIKTGNGPLDGMRRRITQVSELPQAQSDIVIRKKPSRDGTYIIARSNSLTIGLGSILTDPFDPETQLLPKEDIDNIPNLVTIQINEKAAKKKVLDGKANIWKAYLDAAESRLTSSGRSSKDTLTKFESMESHYFNPNDAYLSKTLSNPSVRAYLNHLGSAPMYMITGVKVVRGVRGTDMGQRKSNANLGFDSVPIGVPVTIGPDALASSRQEQTSSSSEASSDFVYAYQVSQISRGRPFRDKENDDFKEGALFFTEQDDEEDLEISSWELRDFDIRSFERYREDPKGLVLFSTEDGC